jgi:Ca2+-binding RTX toxin-like protein
VPTVLVATGSASADTGPGPNGLIAFERFVEYQSGGVGSSDLFSALPDGSEEINLTQTEGPSEIEPAWSPDGSRIAFSSDRDGHYEIYTMAADGTDVQQVTFVPQGESWEYNQSFEPTWSPDGTQIAFTGYRSDNFANEIFIVAAEATEETYVETVVTDTTDFLSASDPDWSPDGETLAYVQYYDMYSTNIATIGVDGTGVTVLTADAGDYVTDWDPGWSPDGTRITWISNRAATDPLGVETDVYVMQADGTGVVAATTDPEVEYDPTFSPDGLQILYQINYYNPEIWVVDAPPPPGGTPGAETVVDDPVRVGSGGSPSWQRRSGIACTIMGTAGNDVLTGSAGIDVICGLGGDDTIRGQGGQDRLIGGSGADTIFGGGGRDRLQGQRGADALDGGNGKDRCDSKGDTAPPVSCER